MAKKIVKPTNWEQSQIDKTLRKKYPHMLTESWIARLSKKVRKELKRRRESKAYRLGVAGISKKKTERMVGK